jgi:hypothetical protein
MTEISQNRLILIRFNQGFETKGCVKRFSVIREVDPYDSGLSERIVTLGCAQFQVLMVPENARRNLNREPAIIVESNNYPGMEIT